MNTVTLCAAVRHILTAIYVIGLRATSFHLYRHEGATLVMYAKSMKMASNARF